MELLVEAVSGTKLGIKAQGKWFNKSKALRSDFSELKAGDVIDAQITDDKWVNSYTVKGKTEQSPEMQKASGNKDEQIARSTAVKAVFSGFASELLKTKDFSEAAADGTELADRLTKFILNGTI